MPLPEKFSHKTHLKDTYIRVHNKAVRREFSDVGDDDWQPDIGTSRASLRTACTIFPTDTMSMIEMRADLFFLHLRQAQDLQQPVYGIPIEEFQSKRATKPQINLYFLEDYEDTDDGYSQVTGDISFRIMDSDDSLTESQLTTYANRIKTKFCIAASGLIWKKGKDLASYKELDKGYDFRLLSRNISDAKELITDILYIKGDTPDWDNLVYSAPDNPTGKYPTIPGNQTILGKSRRKIRRRPIASVRFQYATITIHGLPHPICLVDRNYRFKEAIIRST